MAEKVERRLTVIVSADVVGYARLTAGDEAGTRATLNNNREALIARGLLRTKAASSS